MTQQQQPIDPYAWRAPGPPPARGGVKVGRIVLLIVVLVVVCFAGVAVGAFFAQPEASSTSSADSTAAIGESGPATASAKAPEVVEAAPEVDDGVWTVGVDLPAGKYRTTEAVSSQCYWSITKTGTNGSDIVQNGIPGGGRPSVTLKRGQDFETQRCGTWRKV
jgi:hypothetical protein